MWLQLRDFGLTNSLTFNVKETADHQGQVISDVNKSFFDAYRHISIVVRLVAELHDYDIGGN